MMNLTAWIKLSKQPLILEFQTVTLTSHNNDSIAKIEQQCKKRNQKQPQRQEGQKGKLLSHSTWRISWKNELAESGAQQRNNHPEFPLIG